MPHSWFCIVNAGTSADGKSRARMDIYADIGESTDWWTGMQQ